MTWLMRVARLRSDDLRQVWPLSVSYALVMAALYVLKPVRNALFLDRFGVQELPNVMLMVAVLGAATAIGYGWLSRSVRVDRLVLGMFGGLSGCLLAFRVLLPLGHGASYYAFYVWVAVYGLVATSLLWQLANLRFNARQARRLFGVIGTGGISGAICGGILTSGLADLIGTENLILVAAVLLWGAWLCLRTQAQGASGPAARRDESPADSALSSIRSSRLLAWMAATVAIIGMVSVVVDVQFNDMVETTFPTKNEKTAFFGRFFAYFNALAITVQLLLTTRVLTGLGVGWALLVLPLSLSLGTLGLVLAPGLITAALLKMADGSLRHSIHKSAFEILFIPIPTAVKKQAKLFLDAAVDSAATGVGALLVMFLLREVGMSYVGLSGVSFALLGGLFVCSYGLRSAYIETLRQAFEKRQLDASALTVDITEAGAVDALLAALNDARNSRRIAYVLDTLGSVRDPRLPGCVLPFLRADSAEVRLRALRVLSAQSIDQAVLAEVERLRQDDDPDVRVEALRLLNAHSPEGPVKALSSQLRSERETLRAAALGVIAESGVRREQALVTPEVIEDAFAIEGAAGEHARMHVATLLGNADRPDLKAYWQRLRDDPSEAVVRETIDSAGRSGDPDHLEWLFGLLADRRYRMDARLGLSHYGGAIVDEIDARMSDPEVPDAMWRVLPRILARIDSQRCVQVLAEHAERAPWNRRRALIEALAKLRNRFPWLHFSHAGFERLLSQELDSCYFHAAVLRLLPRDTSRDPGVRLFANTLAQRREEALARVFSLLGLWHPPRDILNAYRALGRGRSGEVASALEYLDNVLGRREKERLLPLVDPEHNRSMERLAKAAPAHLWPRTLSEAVRNIMSRPDPWLRACALYAMKEADPDEVSALADLAANDRDPVVRETGQALRYRVA